MDGPLQTIAINTSIKTNSVVNGNSVLGLTELRSSGDAPALASLPGDFLKIGMTTCLERARFYHESKGAVKRFLEGQGSSPKGGLKKNSQTR